MMRQPPDQSDRIREQNRPTVRQIKCTCRDVERRKQLVFGQHAGICQHIEQCGFSGVCISDDRGSQNAVLFPAASKKFAVLFHLT